jgi:cell division septum initiation protein DivIVA
MGERGHRSEEHETSSRPGATPPSRDAAALADAAQRLSEEMARQARLYGDAHTLQEALGGPMGQVLEEVKDLEARRNALAEEIGALERRKIELAAEVAQAEKAAKG